MSDPVLGNKSDELGQYEEGRDFEGIQAGRLVERREDVKVRISEAETGDLVITPESRFRSDSPTKFTESPQEITKAQLFDDPMMERGNSPELLLQTAMTVLSKYAVAISRKTYTRDKLIYVQVNDTETMCAFGDRVIVMQDEIESEYCCQTCAGKGYPEEQVCPRCEGKQVERVVNPQDVGQAMDIPCRSCRVLGYDATEWWSSGRVPCAKCRGVGWRGGIIIPHIAQSKPISGIIVSVGPECINTRIGDRVVHSRYAGTTSHCAYGSFTMMAENEIIGGVMKLKQVSQAQMSSVATGGKVGRKGGALSRPRRRKRK